MKQIMRNSGIAITLIALFFLISNIQCSNNPMEPTALQDMKAKTGSLSKFGIVGNYSNIEGKFQFKFQIPPNWKQTSHGASRINSTPDRSDVFVYSPAANYIPRFTIIAFSHNPGYPPDCAEFWSQWRENKLKDQYPDRFLGRVERSTVLLNGSKTPKLVYDMLDESHTITYRSTEYTLVVRGKLCTLQTTVNLSDPNQNEAKTILDNVLNSFAIHTL